MWRFSDPLDYRFARAARRGTWSGQERVPPLVIEWEGGSERVGNFTWPGFASDMIIDDSVAVALREYGVSGFELAPVEMRKGKNGSRGVPRVRLPYSGPQLWDVVVKQWLRPDLKRSTLRRTGGSDQAPEYSVSGIEYLEGKFDRITRELVLKRFARVPGKGVYVRRPKCGTRLLFRLKECPAWIFCSDEVRRMLCRREFTNVSFLEMGDIVP